MFPAFSNAPPAPPGGGDGAFVIDVTEADFEAQVLERSLDVPVLLDCWAPWCGPCRSLGPMLEKLARDYGGRFILAKINTDEAPQISAALRIRSIPLVVLFVGGRPVDQFTGALPEGQIRQFLDKHLQPQVSPIDALRAEAAELAASDPAGAEAVLEEALAHEPGHVDVTLDLAELRIARAALDEAQALLDGLPAAAHNERHAALIKRIALARNRPPGDPRQLAARIVADGKDFEARFALAALQVFDGDFAAAFDQLREVCCATRATAGRSAKRRACS